MGNWNTDVIQPVITTMDPGSASMPDGQQNQITGGRQGEQYSSEVHGKWYTAGYRGRSFIANNGIAGSVIPVMTSTTSQTAMLLYNPLGSGKNVELISFQLGLAASATTVVASVGFGVQTGVGAGVALPTSQVAASNVLTNPVGLGGQGPVAKALNTATITAITQFIDLGISFGTTTWSAGGVGGVLEVFFDGRIILAPGTLIAVQGTVAQTASLCQQFTWAEWPV